MYVIKRNEDGKLVSLPGSKKSYTRSIQKACRFDTFELAQEDCCGNEHPISLHDLIMGRHSGPINH